MIIEEKIKQLQATIATKTEELRTLKLKLIVKQGKSTLASVSHLIEEPDAHYAVYAHHWRDGDFSTEESGWLFIYSEEHKLLSDCIVWDRYSDEVLNPNLEVILPRGKHTIELSELETILPT